MAGRLGGVPLVGLPGNPVSAMVCGRVFLRPAVERDARPARRAARRRCRRGSAATLEPNGPRAHYMRARVAAEAGGWRCTPFSRQDSSLLSVLAEANALLVRPPRDPARADGDDG